MVESHRVDVWFLHSCLDLDLSLSRCSRGPLSRQRFLHDAGSGVRDVEKCIEPVLCSPVRRHDRGAQILLGGGSRSARRVWGSDANSHSEKTDKSQVCVRDSPLPENKTRGTEIPQLGQGPVV